MQVTECGNAQQACLELRLLMLKFFSQVPHALLAASAGSTMDAPLLAGESPVEPKSVRLGFVAGVIQQSKLIAFERLLFRATRGNMFLKSSAVGTVLDPTSGEKQEKAVFVVFFAGERARTKILKVAFMTTMIRCSSSVVGAERQPTAVITEMPQAFRRLFVVFLPGPINKPLRSPTTCAAGRGCAFALSSNGLH